MNGVIYCRVSSKEQIKGTSLESQEAACREYARQHEVSILRTFIELGESAKFADRTQLLELIDFCRDNKGNIQELLVWKLDRFSRNVGDHFSVKAVLNKFGVRIVSVTEPIDTNPEGKLMETILAGFAQFDNDIRAMRTVQGMRRKIHEGLFPWKPPLGYKSANDQKEKKTRPDVPDQPTFGLLQTAWKEFATGRYTKAEIRRLMANWGIVSRHGRTLGPPSIDNLFSNVYYRGTLIDPWSGQEYDGEHVPMVSREEFGRVQQIIGGRNRSVPHHKIRPEFPLRGLVRCDGCGHYLTASFSHGRSNAYGYYHCNSTSCARRGKCLPAAAVHDEFEHFLSEVAFKPALMGELTSAIVAGANRRQSDLAVRRKRIETLRARVHKQKQELITMRVQGLLTDEEFLEQKSALSAKEHNLDANDTFRKLPHSADIRQELAAITNPLIRLKETWAELTIQEKQRFQRLLLPVGFVHGAIRTAELGLLFSTFRASDAGNASGVAFTVPRWNQILKEIREFRDIFASVEEELEAAA